LERLLLERNPLSEILAKRNPRADPRSIQEGSSGTAAAADTDLQGAVKFVPCLLSAARMRMFEHYWFRAHIQGATKGGAKKKTKQERLCRLHEDATWSDPFYVAGSSEMRDRLAFEGLMT
jgi:hypothetical protein